MMIHLNQGYLKLPIPATKYTAYPITICLYLLNESNRQMMH